MAPTNPVLGLAQPGVAAELAAMLEALCAGRPLELVSKVAAVPSTMDRLSGIDSRLRALPGITEAEIIQAMEEDARFEEILRQTLARPPSPSITEESIAAGERFMSEFRQASAMAVLARIERKELIKGSELAVRLAVSEDALGTATESGQLFSIQGPDGEAYYRAFFADDQYAKGAVRKVSQALGSLRGQSKYFFFTSNRPASARLP